jgi:TAT (twin-arginine translocation) pathway signal sequence
VASDEDVPNPYERVGEQSEPSAEAGLLGGPWDRRTFLKAAALGTAAAALWQKGPGLSFGPAAALANDLSEFPCTANDVQIIGTGQIVNEPCNCTPGSTFTAVVAFTVKNIAAARRYCITLHLVPDGTVFTEPFDIILHNTPTGGTSTIAGKTTTTMYARIENFPCNVGLVCFGIAVPEGTGKCDPGTCSTVAWSTTPGDANCTSPDQSPPHGQCRHQQICVQGFGATLTCTTNCTPTCGEQSVLTACVSGGTPPYTFVLHADDGSPDQTIGPTSNTCVTFTVTVTGTVKYTLTVTDSTGCSRTASTTLTAQAINVTLAVAGAADCSGLLVFTPTVTPPGNCTFTYKLDGVPLVASETDVLVVRLNTPTAGKLTYRNLDGVCHRITVTATCGTCTDTASKTVQQCVTTTANCTL